MIMASLPFQSAAFAVAAGPGSPAGGPTAQKAAISRWPTANQQSVDQKIDKAVKEKFASARQATYLVKLNATADVVGAASEARKSAQPAAKELRARSAVIQSLRQTAESTQRGLVADLEQAKKKGEVARFEPFWISNIVSVTSTPEVMKRLAARADVAKILPNAEIFLIKEAPGTGKASASANLLSGAKTAAAGLPSIQSTEWNLDRVGAPIVWDQYGIDGTGIVVASLDTGVEGTHPALQAKWRGAEAGANPAASWFDAVNGQPQPYDDHGHGTHTTGTMVGSEPDGSNQIGVAPGAQWIAGKILAGNGSGTTENILRAGQWILAPGGDPANAPDVVNNSWGGGPGMDDWFRDVVRAWRAAGIFPAFAAGNDGPGDGSISNPGNYPESFATGATDANDNLAGFSGRGPSPYGETKPEIAAPGVNIRSSVPGGGYEGGWNGTSMASPHTAGVVALLRQADASLTVDRIEEILITSATPKTDARYPNAPNNGYGNGILDAYTAVAMVVSGVGTVSGRVVTGGDDFTPPTVVHTTPAESFKYVPLTVTATVTDNISVVNVQVRFRVPGMTWWGAVDMERTAGDHKSGTYAGTLPYEVLQGSAVEYYIVATDYGGNAANHGSRTAPHRVTLNDPLLPGYRQDFEGATPGWTHAGINDPWQIGVPTSGPRDARSGTQVLATNLDGNYLDGTDAYMMTPPLDLRGATAPNLRYWHWYQFETNFDFGFVLASGDGGNTWDVLQAYTGDGGSWREGLVDLSPYAGSPMVFVAFYAATDGSVNAPGWYIDDVELMNDNEPPAAPANLRGQVTPAGSVALRWDAVSAPDLDGYKVYRSGTPGSGYQELSQASGTEYVDATAQAGSTYYYTVTAMDLFGHESARSDEVSVTATQPNAAFRDDMENGDNGWTHVGPGDSWQRGTPSAGPSNAHSGTNVWGTNLGGNYGSAANAALVSPPISLAGLSSVSLSFAHWYRLERNFDFGILEIAEVASGSTWNELARYTSPASGEPVGWEVPLIDLTAYAGRNVQLRFRLTSDGSVEYPGWYIDDVIVAGNAPGGQRISVPLGVKLLPMAVGPKGKPTGPATPTIDLSKAAKGKPAASGSVAPSRSIGIQSLPLGATVTVVELGRVVRTSPANGTFNIMLPAGDYTLRAEAYGYSPQDRQVTVEDGADTSVTFVLQPMPRGQITGVITDRRTGDPLAGATVAVAEDLRIPAAVTGADGRYNMEVLQGSYTAQARATGYYPDNAPVDVAGNSTELLDFQLEPFVGVPGEIAYDDGSAENAWGFFNAGNGWAVRMTPPSGAALLTGARYYLWDSSWPSPGGNTFQAAVFDSKPDGTPGRMIAGPMSVTNATRGGWNHVDLSGYGITVTGDFYVAYIQDAANPNMPGMATDDSSAPSNRNYQWVEGQWGTWTSGNLMIRAEIATGVEAPYITLPADESYINQANLTVSGTSAAGTLVTLYVDEVQAATATADAEGAWSVQITLAEGLHALTATATVPGSGQGAGTTEPSPPILVTLDTGMPNLTLSSPIDGTSSSNRIITVSGTVSDTNLDTLTVNGTAIAVGSGGAFTTEVIGQDGSNTIAVTARDKAGNATTLTRTVTIDSTAPALSNMQPASARNLATGDVLIVAFDSEPGLATAAFRINVGGASGAGAPSATAGRGQPQSLEPGETAMREVRPGHYEGTWTVPAGMSADAATVQFRAVDAVGNVTRASAPGTLRIIASNRPVAVIRAVTTARAGDYVVFDGRASRDPDGRIVSYAWDFGDGGTGSGNRLSHRFMRPGTYVVTLTVTDNSGATGSVTHTIQINPR